MSALTITFEIDLTGEHLPQGAVRLLEVARELAGELAEGAVRVTPPDAVERLTAVEQLTSRQDGRPPPVADLTDGQLSGHGRLGGDGQPSSGGQPSDDGRREARDGRPEAREEVLEVFPGSRTVVRDGQQLRLTRLEFDLLLFLCEHPGRVFHRAELLRAVWGYDQTGARTVDVHIRRLRAKLGVRRPLVTTVHGVGYRLDDRVGVTITNQ